MAEALQELPAPFGRGGRDGNAAGHYGMGRLLSGYYGMGEGLLWDVRGYYGMGGVIVGYYGMGALLWDV